MSITPLLVDVNFPTFEDYIKSLGKTGKKNLAYTVKMNGDLKYSQIEFDENLILSFMQLWEQQIVGGAKIRWGIGWDFIKFLNEKKHLLCFAARKEDNENTVVAVQFVEKHGEYVYCYPPLYDKDKYSDRYLAKYMWFHLIRFTIKDPKIKWLDLGGGNRGTWRDLLINRKKGTSYKWLYVSKLIKESPEEVKPYIIRMGIFRYSKSLIESPLPPSKLMTYCINKYVTWRWIHRNKRLKMIGCSIRRSLDKARSFYSS